MGGGSGKLAGREGAAPPISWWPVARAKVSIMCVVVVVYSMLCSCAARWCGVTEEIQYQFQSPVAGGCVMTSFSRQWSYSNWPVDSSMTTRLLLLFTNLAACRQYGCVLFLAFAIKRDDFGQGMR